MKRTWKKLSNLLYNVKASKVPSSKGTSMQGEESGLPWESHTQQDYGDFESYGGQETPTVSLREQHKAKQSLSQGRQGQQQALMATFEKPLAGSSSRSMTAGAGAGGDEAPQSPSRMPPAVVPLRERVGTDPSGLSTPPETTPRGYQSNPLYESPPKPSLIDKMEAAHEQALLEQWEQHQAELDAAEARLQELLAQAEAGYQAQLNAAQQKLAQRLLTQMSPMHREEAYRQKFKELQRKMVADAQQYERSAREQAIQVAQLQSRLRALSRELRAVQVLGPAQFALVSPGSPPAGGRQLSRQASLQSVQSLTLGSPGKGQASSSLPSPMGSNPGSPTKQRSGRQLLMSQGSSHPGSPSKQPATPLGSNPGSPTKQRSGRQPPVLPSPGKQPPVPPSPGASSPGKQSCLRSSNAVTPGKHSSKQLTWGANAEAAAATTKSPQRIEIHAAAGTIAAARMSRAAGAGGQGGEQRDVPFARPAGALLRKLSLHLST